MFGSCPLITLMSPINRGNYTVHVFTTYRKSTIDTIMWDTNALNKKVGDMCWSFDFSLRQKFYASVLEVSPC